MDGDLDGDEMIPSSTYIITHLFIISALCFAAFTGNAMAWLVIRWIDRRGK